MDKENVVYTYNEISNIIQPLKKKGKSYHMLQHGRNLKTLYAE